MVVNPEICSPLYTKEKGYSCYTSKHLHQLKQKYNRTHKKKIKTNDPVHIWKELNTKITTCKKESCWAKELRVPAQDVFAPKSPESWKKNNNEWLSTSDIQSVLTQYEKAYPEFKFIGPCASDYYFIENGQCVSPELCNLNVNTETHKYIGVVFNLDVHDGPGTHWVSVFIDLPKQTIYYFDSGGDPIHQNIQKLVDQIKGQNPQFKFVQNHPVEHQFGNTECGVYSLFFIITMLKTKNFNYFKTNSKKTFPDKKIEKLRKKYFNS
jgi:hypothetical protein